MVMTMKGVWMVTMIDHVFGSVVKDLLRNTTNLPFQSWTRNRLFCNHLFPAMAMKDLKTLLREKLAEQAEEEESTELEAARTTDLSILAKKKVGFGKHQDKTYEAAMKADLQYVKWLNDQHGEGKLGTVKAKCYLIYAQRVLQEEDRTSGGRPAVPQNSKKTSKKKERGESSTDSDQVSLAREKREVEALIDEMEEEWSPINLSKMDRLEGEMSTFHNRLNAMEQGMAEILSYMRNQSATMDKGL